MISLGRAELRDLLCSSKGKQNYRATNSALPCPLGSIAYIAMVWSNLSFKQLSFKFFWDYLCGCFFIAFLPITIDSVLSSFSPFSEIL